MKTEAICQKFTPLESNKIKRVEINNESITFPKDAILSEGEEYVIMKVKGYEYMLKQEAIEFEDWIESYPISHWHEMEDLTTEQKYQKFKEE